MPYVTLGLAKLATLLLQKISAQSSPRDWGPVMRVAGATKSGFTRLLGSLDAEKLGIRRAS
jgi:hypothetical protein